MNFITDARKAALAGVALAACLGFTLNAQAQSCTVSNWTAQQNLTDADTGTQGSSNRRYGGPCGLRVPVDSAANYVEDDSPNDESQYNVRFYAYLDNAGGDPIILFSGFDDTDTDLVQVWYNFPNASDLTLRVIDNAGNNDITFGGVGSGWHSIEFAWQADASATAAFTVDGATDQTMTVDTSGQSVFGAQLGNVNGAGTAGSTNSIDFDDFDSRRMDRPGRLMVADANNDGVINSQDFVVVINEIGGSAFASGQPDCNEDGTINSQDFVCVINVISS